ncbi:MAG: DUF1080 domain-containing protein [Verrucomicrobia bacterium]|nr:DUF1080 domain-containing protein [Verrucomicrobiota bacterium]
MAETDQPELHCPWCHTGLGVTTIPTDGSALECPGCREKFYADEGDDNDGVGPNERAADDLTLPADADADAIESLDSYLERKVRGKLPEPKEKPRLAPKSGGEAAGWSKWEHASPTPRKPEYTRKVRKADEADRLPKPLIEDLVNEQRQPLKFSEFSHTSLPQEREIDREQRRRRDVLQKGWEALSDPAKQDKGPTLSRKDSLKFDRNLISTKEREVPPEEVEMKRHQFVAPKDRLGWDEKDSNADDLGNFSIERFERIQRIKTIIVGSLGACAILAAAIGLFVGISKLQDPDVVVSDNGNSPTVSAPALSDFSVRNNYSTIITKLREFLEAEDVDAMLNTVRNRSSVDQLVRDYYAAHPYERLLLRDVPSPDSILIVDGFVVVECVVGQGERLFVPMEIAAGLKIDWEAVVGYSAMGWEEFKQTKPKSPTLFRVCISPTSYYNYGFKEQDCISFQIADPKLDHVIYGYIPRRGPLIDEFVQLFPDIGNTASTPLRAVVELKYRDQEFAANQVEIVSVKARGWVYRRDVRAATHSLELFANDAKADGGKVRLDEEFRITDWDANSTTLEWRVDIESPVQVSAFAVMANGGSEGKKVALTAGPQRIEQEIPKTNSWNTFSEVLIGILDFDSPGGYTFRMKSSVRIDEPLMTLDKLVFRAGSELKNSKVRDPTVQPQVHPIARLADLKIPKNTLTDPERTAGWRMLFSGEDLKGWTGYRQKEAPAGWSVQASQLMLIEPGCGPLIATEEFENFEMKLEWQASDGQASGVFFRVVENKKTIEETGIEIELNGYGYSALSTEKTTELTANGAVKHLYPAERFTPDPSGWNTLRVRFNENEFQYWINDVEMGFRDKFNIIRPIEIGSEDWNQRIDGSRFRRFQRFAKSPKGYIALEDAGTPIRFRNIKILPLDNEP